MPSCPCNANPAPAHPSRLQVRVGSTSPIKRTPGSLPPPTGTRRECGGAFPQRPYYRRAWRSSASPRQERKANPAPGPLLPGLLLRHVQEKTILSAAAEQILEAYHWRQRPRTGEPHPQLVSPSRRGPSTWGDLPIAKPAGRAGQHNTSCRTSASRGNSFKDISRQIEDKILLMGLQQYGSLRKWPSTSAEPRHRVRRVKKMEREWLQAPFRAHRTPAAPLPR
jgi:hypothetical protein